VQLTKYSLNSICAAIRNSVNEVKLSQLPENKNALPALTNREFINAAVAVISFSCLCSGFSGAVPGQTRPAL